MYILESANYASQELLFPRNSFSYRLFLKSRDRREPTVLHSPCDHQFLVFSILRLKKKELYPKGMIQRVN